jgi:glucosamine--fructose-6-phosphate aminotransferase (isomerizing)
LIAFSHSGASKTVVDAVKFAREKGVCTVAMTSTSQSPITKASDYAVMVPGREEKAGPKTRSYTAGLMVMYLFSIGLGALVRPQDSQRFLELRKNLDSVCGVVEATLKNTEKRVVELAEKYKNLKDLFVVGGGPNYATALEAAIKLKEASLIHAEGVEVEEMAHGLLAVLDDETGLIAIAPPGKSYTRTLDIVNAANTIGSPTISMVSEEDVELSKISTEVIRMPSGIEELFSPTLYIVPLQMLSYYLAIKKGHMPDWVRTEEPKYSKANGIVFPPGTH